MSSTFDSWVLIRFVTKLDGLNYRKLVNEAMIGFITEVDSDFTQDKANQLIEGGQDWNKEGCLHGFCINKQFIYPCKVYYYDTEEEMSYFCKSIVFRDHYSKGATKGIFEIVEVFEQFLKKESIEYERENRYRE